MDLWEAFAIPPQALRNEEADGQGLQVARQGDQGQHWYTVEHQFDALFLNDLVVQGGVLVALISTDRPVDGLLSSVRLLVQVEARGVVEWFG